MIRSSLSDRSELKYFIFTSALTTAFAAGGTFPVYPTLIQGDDSSFRTGRVIKVQKFRFRYTAFLPVLAGVGSIRFIVVQDTSNTGVNVGTLEILNTASVTSPPNPSATLNKRFTFLYDKVHSMVVGGADQKIDVNVMLPVKQSHVHFNGTTAAITSVGKNSVFVLVLTDLVANQPQFAFDYETRFIDS
jgi:hypothetical protein